MPKDLYVSFGINSKTRTLAISLAHDSKVNSKLNIRTMLHSDKRAVATEMEFLGVPISGASTTIAEILSSIREKIPPESYNKVELYSDVNLIEGGVVTPIFLTTDIQNIFKKPLKMTLFSGTSSTVDAARDIFLSESNRKLLGEDPSLVHINLLVKGAKMSRPIYPLQPDLSPVSPSASTEHRSSPSTPSSPGTPLSPDTPLSPEPSPVSSENEGSPVSPSSPVKFSLFGDSGKEIKTEEEKSESNPSTKP
ncbi:Uncharacterised protein [Legionella wadsworthii]|uniref:Uncharacterized protein n=1 Tax=Legionella wadsworthii TaxID=28088 RepID=A0A378LPF9_9GAMM|nr:hypothetical protein [Legionella wadsworthii]STY28816.1 Uncharacterised protein [Legionella wadsworthii]